MTAAPRPHRSQRLRCAARRAGAVLTLALLLAPGLPAHAQLRLPSVNLPGMLPQLPVTPQDTLRQAVPLEQVRARLQRELLRRHADLVEPDPAGQPVRRAELLWLSPSPPAVQAALAQGFTLLREQDLPELGLRQLVLRPPAGVATAEAAQRLRTIEPETAVDFNHLYQRSGETGAAVPAAPPASALAPAGRTTRVVGLVDAGVDRRHPALAGAQLQAWGCEGREAPSAHGTAVASLLVGRDGEFSGLQPGATLYAADVYCEQPDGGSVEQVARALAWLVREQVPVINISLVGPPNLLLQRATEALLRRGHVIVAAVGNDGPLAPPLFPAAYPGVVGVSGVTPSRQALPEAAQGPQVSLCAPGSDLAVARPGGGYVIGRGTSFAAPIVAGLLAERIARRDPQAAADALAQLARDAVDLGAPGRDAVYGLGLVGEAARIAPRRVGARRP